MKNELKSLGIIGCGSVVRKFYVPFINNLPGYKLNYVTDINVDEALELSVKLNCQYTNLQGLIENSDIIIVATPPHTHYDLIKRSLRENKIVICEKPFVSSLSEAEELVKLSKIHNAQLYVAHVRRCYPSVKLAKELVETGIMGELKEIFLQEGGKFNYKAASNYVYENSLGGVLLDTGSHTIDTALFITNLYEDDIKNILVNELASDCKEPSNEIKVMLKLVTTRRTVKLNLHLSRLRVLANKISLIFENGEIHLPVELSNYVKVVSNLNSSIIYSKASYSNFLDLFPVQYFHMVNEKSMMNNNFKADQFINLVEIFETILKNNS